MTTTLRKQVEELQWERYNEHSTNLLAELYEARRAHRQAKAAYTDKAWGLGERCNGQLIHYQDEESEQSGPCYDNTKLPRAEWCNRCDTLQPLWEAKQATGARAGKALRACTTRGRQIVERRTP